MKLVVLISSLERRLEQEAQEVAALAAEARNAMNVINRIRVQRRAVRAQRKHLVTHLTSLKDTGKSMHSTINTSRPCRRPCMLEDPIMYLLIMKIFYESHR